MDADQPTPDAGVEQRRRIREEGTIAEEPEVLESLDEERELESLLETEELPAGDAELEDLAASADLDRLEQVDEELAEDLRRAQPNPPQTVRLADPDSDVDLGYLEDPDARSDDYDEGLGPVELDTVDPLEAEREERDRPGTRS
jgi:hypothetical protein